MILRQANPDDAAGICEIANAVIRDTLITFTTTERSAADIAAEISQRGAAYQVAEQEGKVIGFATYGPFRSGPGYARTKEHSIQVAQGYRGLGVGRKLLRKLEQVAIDDGVHVLVAGVSGANSEGLAFHQALGFIEVGRMPEVGTKAGKWIDLILMQKILHFEPAVGPDSAAKEG